MTDPRPDPNLTQRRAADPKSSVWVAASAGSGKTKVLTDRVLALLVDGAKPDGLLCVTFTKAAAAEMANRIHRELSKWTRMDEGALSTAIRNLDGGTVTPQKLARARRLFAQVLDLPGGLRIRTIHSFCQSVLGRFPLEARVAPNFEAMDERQAAEAMELARDTVLGAAEGNATLNAALTAVTARAAEGTFSDLMAGLSRHRAWLAPDALRRVGGLDGAIAALHQALGAEPGLDEDQVIADACAPGVADEAALRLAATALLDFGTGPNQEKGRIIAAWLAGGRETRIATFDRYIGAYLTRKYEPLKTLCVKAVAENSPATPDVLMAEQDRLLAVDQRLRRQATARASEGLLRLGEAVLRAYEANKRATARLDYDDLIHLTGRLLTKETVPWVLFKLDGGLTHMLIDEAQDTSADQRAIIDALVTEFFSGQGRAEQARTLFVVGDAKQSIYSFQGADPEGYRQWRDSLTNSAQAGGQDIRRVPMDISFRSVQAVLDVVDSTFAEMPARDGVVEPDEPALKHHAFRAGLQGRVEVWPPTVPPEAQEDDLFTIPSLEGGSSADATQTLAEGLAETISGWIRNKEILPAKGRPIRAGDILFLVQRRTVLIDALVRELKRRSIPVAGVDRITLTEQIAVMDLLALARALLLPQDDLTFACLLKSPFVGMDDDDLFHLATDRGAQSLWQRLSALKAQNPRFAAAARWFDGLLDATDRLAPYELFQRALISPCPGPGKMATDSQSFTGRQALVARLGTEVEDPLEEFLTLTLDHDRTNTPSLEGFLAWFARGNTDLKRDLETEARDEVRIMTVHGAKGLQAPIVILPDAMTKSGARGTPLRWLSHDSGVNLPIWTPSSRYEEPVAASLKEAEKAATEREYRRLLYVAMTRAEDRLIVTGRLPRTTPPEGNWHALVKSGLERLDGTVEVPFLPSGADADGTAIGGWTGDIQLYETGNPGTETDKKPDRLDLMDKTVPRWLTAAPPEEPAPPRPLTPSRPGLLDPAVRSPLRDDDPLRFKRGKLIHRLLQTLPDLPVVDREQAAMRYLALPAHGLTEEEQSALWRETDGVLRHAAFAPLFGPDSRAEVPLAGLVLQSGESLGPFAVSGQVDRLLIARNEILVVDYKTLRPAPTEASAVPRAYLAQMAGYRAILRQIYPDRAVQCALVFTETPRLVALPDAVLDRVA
ncbi:MAG: double-strand break repair helicase AddA [Rhodospirillaceae bacterium]|jgi:ATP-dependent helicase/nuclease subunit A|uniref:double-strand break repair helicase AddA n=1 Tax=Hwanghaeella sp. 1Z406 TaxID=3402811 RepID=UPI000C52B9EA|nr:double-strand break repair helicase AddA [Rhodospirillales bacterium]MAX47596.1 double-strand break repair helicase AddA [Rhodospirillaceae bacterium]|tara:strand:- start:47257 stop:50787 length:3531 start_codon:yes stop_codon:yes gene_type:complete